jgi:hypothetical protein
MARLILTLIASILGLILILPLLILVLPLWAFSTLTRAIADRLARRTSPWQSIIEYEPELGWKQKPNLRVRYADKNGDSCRIQTDAEGWPGAESIEQSDVVVFGDSFTFGYGVDFADAYFSQSKNCRIKAIGSPGYNMVQALLWMRRYASRLRGKTVVWFICMENDLAENLKAYTSDSYPTPFLRARNGTTDWEIIADHLQPKTWLERETGISNTILFAYLCTPCPYSERVYAAARYLIQEAKTICQSHGARLVLFSIPYKMQLEPKGRAVLRNLLRAPEELDLEYPDKRLSAICGELEIPFIAGARHLTAADYKPRDGHWNAAGNRKVAEVIERHHRETGAR